ncbi:MAG: hypothetical protein KGN16_20080 [Burkholderiales bacterium]|nr:hypothetical protein [Burkholderiales bacterium]
MHIVDPADEPCLYEAAYRARERAQLVARVCYAEAMHFMPLEWPDAVPYLRYDEGEALQAKVDRGGVLAPRDAQRLHLARLLRSHDAARALSGPARLAAEEDLHSDHHQAVAVLAFSGITADELRIVADVCDTPRVVWPDDNRPTYQVLQTETDRYLERVGASDIADLTLPERQDLLFRFFEFYPDQQFARERKALGLPLRGSCNDVVVH